MFLSFIDFIEIYNIFLAFFIYYTINIFFNGPISYIKALKPTVFI